MPAAATTLAWKRLKATLDEFDGLGKARLREWVTDGYVRQWRPKGGDPQRKTTLYCWQDIHDTITALSQGRKPRRHR